jgi:hypothetical protein
VTEAERLATMRQAAREVLRELLPDILEGEAAGSRDSVVPLVPAPPVAAVLRPSTWTAPAGPGEVIGDAQPASAPPSDGARVEAVTLDSDADLQRFVASLLTRVENPGELGALRTGRLRFALRRTPEPPALAGAGAQVQAQVMRVDKGAVTERIVREAAAAGARLVLARRAVLTPLARDQARALHVAIERQDT